MSGYHSLENYSPCLTLIVGILGFGGISGCGMLAWQRANLQQPWHLVVGIVTGVLGFGFGVQIVGVCEVASTAVLSSWLFVWVSAGGVYWLVQCRKMVDRSGQQSRSLLIVSVPCLILLVMAISGSTKIDELYYHMLLPARVVAEQKLTFYNYPWQSAVPQMAYQISLTPFHALGFPHAGNVVSCLIAVSFAYFAYRLVIERKQSSFRAAVVASTLLVGMYPMVWYVTSGAHALGDLALASAIIACVGNRTLRRKARPNMWNAMVSTLLVGAALTKISLLPVIAFVWGAVVLQGFRQVREVASWKTVGRSVAALTIPWLVFYVPVLGWTWFQSGSPFGPVLAGRFGESVYVAAEVRQAMASRNVGRFPGIANLFAYDYSPAFWLFLIGFFLSRIPRKVIPSCALALQVALLVTVLPVQLRYLGGTQFAAVILGAMYVPSPVANVTFRRVLVVVSFLPWIALQSYYVSPFCRFVIGITPERQHYQRYVAFYDDFRNVDELLPRDAVLLTVGVRPNSIYFPREILPQRSPIPTNRPIFAFTCNQSLEQIREKLPGAHEVANLVYENPDCLRYVSRIPGVPGQRGHLRVYQLNQIGE